MECLCRQRENNRQRAGPAGENKTVTIVITGLTETVAINLHVPGRKYCLHRSMDACMALIIIIYDNIIFDYRENWQLKLASYSYIRRSYVG